MKNNQPSRRKFIKNSTLFSGGILAGSSLACNNENAKEIYWQDYSFSLPDDFSSINTKVSGILYSQIGYNLGETVKIIIRVPEKELMTVDTTCKLIPEKNEDEYQQPFTYWGEQWKSHWWIAEFKNIEEEGTWKILVNKENEILYKQSNLRVKKEILWQETHLWASVDMLERRKHFTGVGAGWQDAGALWAESPAQSAMIICLTDIAEYKHSSIDENYLKRVYEQITVGADYLVMTQEKAKELGYPEGAMSHDLLGHEDFILPNDVAKAVVALYKSAKVLPEQYSEKIEKYVNTADTSLDWLLNKATPMGDYGYSKFQRGLSESTKIPSDEWLTRDLIFLCWGALERYKKGDKQYKEISIAYANQILQRQIPIDTPEQGYYGHFKEFDSLPHSENLWVHAIKHKEYGADAGGLFPNYLIPFFEMLELWPNHENASKWKKMLKNYADGFLIPSCFENPFLIVPNGIFGNEGPIWFAGFFHGTNSIYGYTAAIAAKLYGLFKDEKLKAIAFGNLQWIAGLNAGVTHDCLKGSVIYSEDIPKNQALPRSMVNAIGNKTAGTWFNTRGVVCNGFSTGKQFEMDVTPKKENDGPFSLTDEDWIPHSAAFLTGVMELNKISI
ncbi:hypothetical protein HX109_09715 [Galbibacter sp. BG1]|uniref:hypothetical protein n=1 Tax=Galbibacter sp. BG1 TaxID=1170699 RepID=UPI0015C08C61|nr:hypothetical protein [Galbibacter sp. BG1]QLE01820.1 hypothetical protein HX109_09715 [Galbibacter sp. BG1]